MELLLDYILNTINSLIALVTAFFHSITVFYSQIWCNIIFLFEQVTLLFVDYSLIVPFYILSWATPVLNSINSATLPMVTTYCSINPGALWVMNSCRIPEAIAILVVAFTYRAKMSLIKFISS